MFYWRGVRSGKIDPNAASWFIWAYGSLLNFATYNIMSGDMVKDILPFMCSVSCMVIFALMVYRNGIGRLDKIDYAIIASDIAVTFIWFLIGATEANLTLQLTEFISFIPLIRGLLRGTDKEEILPWAIWSVAYTLMTVTVVIRWDKWQDVVYPVVAVVLHMTILVVSKIVNKK
ncbi:MAG TPA: hypothetical protein PJ997_01105 [Candidatus Paceibacterota bacterium]|nr:hypothetical protein [Candidatus Paceibacterota bacterium]HMP18921.1 hypothetical protein [Candidatus Paceibacterota bacterium]